MLKKENYKRATINVEPTKWELFKKVAKYNQSDANKELRKYIDKYLEANKQLVMSLNLK